MRILLDESIPRGLRRLLPGHEVRTVAEQGWRSFRNSTLLELAQDYFDVLVTADQGIEHQQNLDDFDIGVIILVASSNRLVDYEPLTTLLQAAVEEVHPGRLKRVGQYRWREMFMTTLITGLALVLVGQLQAQQVVKSSSDKPTVAEVLALREKLGTAALTGDVAAIREILSSELVVSDPGNNIRRRDDLISLFEKRQVAYRSISATIDFADQLGDLVVIMGTQSTVLEAAPPGSQWTPGTTLLRRFTDVFRNEDGSWRLIVRQSTVFQAK